MKNDRVAAIVASVLLLLWIVPIIFVLSTTSLHPNACPYPFYGWLAVWPVFWALPESWQTTYVELTFLLCR